MSDKENSGTERPDGWPELWLDPGPPCSHKYHWDDADGLYRCIDCDDTIEEPPESKRSVDTGTDQEEHRA